MFTMFALVAIDITNIDNAVNFICFAMVLDFSCILMAIYA